MEKLLKGLLLQNLLDICNNTKDPILLAKQAYLIHLDYSEQLNSYEKVIIKDLMLMEADDSMILPEEEINLSLNRLITPT